MRKIENKLIDSRAGRLSIPHLSPLTAELPAVSGIELHAQAWAVISTRTTVAALGPHGSKLRMGTSEERGVGIENYRNLSEFT